MGYAVTPVAQEVVLGKLIAADMNSTADQAITLISGNKQISRIVAINASATPAATIGGIYGSASKAGTIFVAAAQAWGALTAILSLNLTLAANYVTGTTIYLSLSTPKGTAGTADVIVYGYVLPT